MRWAAIAVSSRAAREQAAGGGVCAGRGWGKGAGVLLCLLPCPVALESHMLRSECPLTREAVEGPTDHMLIPEELMARTGVLPDSSV